MPWKPSPLIKVIILAGCLLFLQAVLYCTVLYGECMVPCLAVLSEQIKTFKRTHRLSVSAHLSSN